MSAKHTTKIAAKDGKSPFTVIGFYRDNNQRQALLIRALNPDDAEGVAVRRSARKGWDFVVCGVASGRIVLVDDEDFISL